MLKQKLIWTIILLPILTWGLLGCGSQSEEAVPPADAAEAVVETPVKTEEIVEVPAADQPAEVAPAAVTGLSATYNLPTFADAEVLYENETLLDYVTPAEVDTVVDFSRRELSGQGWQEYTPPFSQQVDDPTLELMSFRKDGVALSVFITVAPAQGGKTSVQYHILPLEIDLPTMADAVEVQFDDKRPYLSYTTAADFETVLDFYGRELPAIDLAEVPEMGVIEEEQGLRFFKGEEMALALNLSQAGDGRTAVTLSPLSLEELANLMAPPEPALTEPEIQPVADNSTAGMPALPFPDDAQAINYDPDLEEVTYTSATDIETLVELYRQTLSPIGWQEDADFAVVGENFGSLTFEQGDASLDFFFTNDGSGQTEVSIDIYGLASGVADDADVAVDTTELAQESGPAFDINDWPIPDEAEEVQVTSDEVSYVIDWDFQSVADFYLPTYVEMGMSEGCLEPDPDFSSYSCGTGDGDLSISLNLFNNFDDRTEVSFTFFGLTEEEADTSQAETGEPAVLTLVEKEGVPVPSDIHGDGSFGSEFRMELSGISNTGLNELVELYRRELAAQGWTEQTEAAIIEDSQASLTFQEPESTLIVELSYKAGETKLYLTHKRTAAAAEQGILPPTGQARLFVGSMNDENVTITINGQTLTIAPTSPQAEPKDLLSLDLAPGQYTYTVAFPGAADVNETLELEPDTTWMLAILPGATFPVQAY